MARQDAKVSGVKWYRSPYPWLFVVVVGIIAFLAGWYLRSGSMGSAGATPLRLSGYQFIDPLLACNISHTFSEDQSMHKAIQQIIDTNVSSGNLTKGSVYFVDLKNGNWSDVYPDDEYYPSSLGKIPIMMAYYEMAASDPSILNEKIAYDGGTNLDQMQDIPPPQAIVAGQTYTVEQLIEYMIEDSDNNAAQLLYENVNQSDLNNIYTELGIPTEQEVTASNADIVTPQEIGLLFRLLYNATYISRDYSEQALSLMSQSSFAQGLVAGVPQGTVVSHKLGLVGIYNGNTAVAHELHDCGIVYAQDPYLLCVMTKGSASLPTMEGIIASISKTVYEQVENQ